MITGDAICDLCAGLRYSDECRCLLDAEIPSIGRTEREVNRLALALHELDDITPGSPPAATWGVLWTLLGDPAGLRMVDTLGKLPLNRPKPEDV